MYKIFKTSKGKILNLTKIANSCWIDLQSPTEKDLAELKPIIDIPEDVIVSIRDVDEVPKVEKQDDFNLILLQTPHLIRVRGEDEDEEPTISHSVKPLGILYNSNIIVTVSDGKNDVIDYLHLKLKNFQKNKIIHTDNIPQFILKILLFTAKIYLRYLKAINHKIRAAQHNLEQSPQNDEIINLMNLEKSLVYFSTSLHSNHIVFEKLAKRKYFTSNEDDEELVEDILDETRQALETAKIYAKIVGNVSNTFASIISNNLNQTVKSLTNITIILMLPTLVASIYGMNVNLPFQNSPSAFFIIMGIAMILSLLGAFIFFRKKKP